MQTLEKRLEKHINLLVHRYPVLESVKQEIIDAYLEIISSADTIETQDYGIYDIICDEINSYYTQSRSPEQIVTTLDQRLTLYCQENYQ